MARKSKNTNGRMLEEISDLVDEIKATMKSYDFDVVECEVDEAECFDVHGEDVYRLYELIREIDQITNG